MSDITIGIVADMRRKDEAWDLADKVGAQIMCYDDGTVGCTDNHIRVWTRVLQHGGDWAVVLEDDALVGDDFAEQLRMVLDDPPEPIVGLYLGRVLPRAWQRFIKIAFTKHVDAHWLTASHFLHGVGTAVRMDLLPDMLRFVGHMTDTEKLWPVDEQITHWARIAGYRVAYTKPSIVQHGDLPTLLTQAEHNDGTDRGALPPRVAWEFGRRDAWDSTSVKEMMQ